MKFPNPGTNARTIIDTIEKHGGMTIEDSIQLHGEFSSRGQIEELYNNMVTHGWLLYFDGKYFLSSITRGKLKKERGEEDKPDVAGKRELIWKAWTGRYDLDPRGPRERFK